MNLMNLFQVIKANMMGLEGHTFSSAAHCARVIYKRHGFFRGEKSTEHERKDREKRRE
jgi:hypothetical protein